MTRALTTLDGHEALVSVEGDQITIVVDQDTEDLQPLVFDTKTFRAAVEAEAFEHGAIIPGGPGTEVGRRKL